jgi:hypothetical protein
MLPALSYEVRDARLTLHLLLASLLRRIRSSEIQDRTHQQPDVWGDDLGTMPCRQLDCSPGVKRQ